MVNIVYFFFFKMLGIIKQKPIFPIPYGFCKFPFRVNPYAALAYRCLNKTAPLFLKNVPYLRSKTAQTWYPRWQNVHILIARQMALFINWVSQAIVICKRVSSFKNLFSCHTQRVGRQGPANRTNSHSNNWVFSYPTGNKGNKSKATLKSVIIISCIFT